MSEHLTEFVPDIPIASSTTWEDCCDRRDPHAPVRVHPYSEENRALSMKGKTSTEVGTFKDWLKADAKEVKVTVDRGSTLADVRQSREKMVATMTRLLPPHMKDASLVLVSSDSVPLVQEDLAKVRGRASAEPNQQTYLLLEDSLQVILRKSADVGRSLAEVLRHPQVNIARAGKLFFAMDADQLAAFKQTALDELKLAGFGYVGPVAGGLQAARKRLHGWVLAVVNAFRSSDEVTEVRPA